MIDDTQYSIINLISRNLINKIDLMFTVPFNALRSQGKAQAHDTLGNLNTALASVMRKGQDLFKLHPLARTPMVSFDRCIGHTPGSSLFLHHTSMVTDLFGLWLPCWSCAPVDSSRVFENLRGTCTCTLSVRSLGLFLLWLSPGLPPDFDEQSCTLEAELMKILY